MAVNNVSNIRPTSDIHSAINAVLPVARRATAAPMVPLGPVQPQEDGPTRGIATPVVPYALPTAEQVVARRVGMVLGEGRKHVPLSQLTRNEVRSLTRVQVGRTEAADIQRNLRRSARVMRMRWQGAGQTELASVAASLERAPVAPGTMSLHDALAAIEAGNRLRGASSVGSAALPNANALEQTPDGAVITEFYISFGHDLVSMVGPEFEPSGFKFFLAPTTPAADNSNAVRTIDLPVGSDRLIHDAQANTFNLHFSEIDGDLDPGTQYYLWAVAYNSEGDSIHSNHVLQRFASGVRGDLNGDGQINMIDVNHMLGILLDGGLPYQRADLNQDGENTQEDLDLLIDMVNG